MDRASTKFLSAPLHWAAVKILCSCNVVHAHSIASNTISTHLQAAAETLRHIGRLPAWPAFAKNNNLAGTEQKKSLQFWQLF